VTKRYFWTREEETRLLELWRKGIRDFKVLDKEMRRTPRTIKLKLTRLGVVEVERKISSTTTAMKSKGPFAHKETLKILASAIGAVHKLGQDRLGLQRLGILVDLRQMYDAVLEKFER